MNIQWFPGHMTKALRMMQENAKLVDSFVYVLDARIFKSSINEKFNAIINNKPVLYVLNKSDMIDSNVAMKIKNYFEKQDKTIVVANSKNGANVKEIISKLKVINKEKIYRNKAKGVNKTIRAMVIGIPNTGKSTMINSIVGGKKTITGNKPGVTKGKQWVVIDNSLELLDTPGTLCPAFDNQDIARNIAFIGSIKDDIMDMQELCYELVKFLKENNTNCLAERYNVVVEENADAYELVEQIAKKKALLIKGGEIDYERAYMMIVDDFRKGRLGKIALELPI